MSRIFIYGVPGSGKTYTSRKMAQDLDLPLLEADALKEDLRKDTTKEESPFLFLGTCQAWRQFGELNSDNAIKGLLEVRKSLADKVQQEAEAREGIIEGAFLDPNLLKKVGKMILIVTKDSKKHENQFFKNRERSDENISEFQAARIIQEFLINEGKGLGVQILEND